MGICGVGWGGRADDEVMVPSGGRRGRVRVALVVWARVGGDLAGGSQAGGPRGRVAV